MISTSTHIVNDETCIIHEMEVPVEEVEVIPEGRWYEKVSIKSKRKFFRMIDKTIDYTKEVFRDTYCEVYDRTVCFEIRTRDKKSIEIENYIRDTLNNNGFNVDKYDVIDYEKNGWVRFEGVITPKKESIEFLEKLFNIQDWEVVFDGHLETMYLYIKLNVENLE